MAAVVADNFGSGFGEVALAYQSTIVQSSYYHAEILNLVEEANIEGVTGQEHHAQVQHLTKKA